MSISASSRALLAGTVLALAALMADAQRGAGPGGQQRGDSGAAQRASVGAGTTNGSTTGTSHPMKMQDSASGVPPPPSAELCADYENQVREDCLAVVLKRAEAADTERPAEEPTQ